MKNKALPGGIPYRPLTNYFEKADYCKTKSRSVYIEAHTFVTDPGAKTVFRFSDTDMKSTGRDLRSHEEQLTQVLNDTMPGLAAGQSDNFFQVSLATAGGDDRVLGGGQHHRLLVKPNAFHVTILFQPTLSFLERAAETLPSDIDAVKNSTSHLDDFVLKVYLPQLEEKVSLVFHQAVTGEMWRCWHAILRLIPLGPEAFLPDPLSKQLSAEPLAKVGFDHSTSFNSLWPCRLVFT